MNFVTLAREDNMLKLLDQTVLPQQLTYKLLDNYQDVITAIKRLEVRGAPAIGIAAAYGLALAAEHQGRHDDLERVASEIRAARPTAVNLAWAVDRVIARLKNEQPSGQRAVADLLWSEAEAIHEEDRQMCDRIGEHGATLIHDGDSVLTHCNAGALATGGIGTALAVIYVASRQGKKIKVYADETRPLLQGARLTSWELQQEGIDVSLLCDNSAGFLMAQGKVKHVVVGADRIAMNGDTANKIGTYTVALLAKEHGIPFYVAAPFSTFDTVVKTGKEIEIEQRAAEEITEGFGRRTAPEGIATYSPAFDVTPNRLITAFITDTGIKPGGRKD